jgi:Uma2 family endonuclease
MASAAALPHDDSPREDHPVRLLGVSWQDYERLEAIRGDSSVPRLTYLGGTLEIMRPSKDHERIKYLIGRLLEVRCLDRGIDLMGYGSWTLKDEPQEVGAEPDECYVFDDRPRDRPQLAIEVQWTDRRLDKLEVYRRLQVEEIWYWRKNKIEVFVLTSSGYQQQARSKFLPDLELELLVSFLDRKSLNQAVRDFRAALAAL